MYKFLKVIEYAATFNRFLSVMVLAIKKYIKENNKREILKNTFQNFLFWVHDAAVAVVYTLISSQFLTIVDTNKFLPARLQ